MNEKKDKTVLNKYDKLNIILGSIALWFTILFIGVAIDCPLLAVAGFVIAPALMYLFNKKITIKPLKYYLSLIGLIFIALIFAGGMHSNKIRSEQQIASKSNTVDEENKEENKEVIKEDTKNVDASNNQEDISEKKESTPVTTTPANNTTNAFDGYKSIIVDGGDLSGNRQPNVVVDIGFGDRQYYAFTNEYGQLVKVIAKEIIPQDDSNEPVNSAGRYYDDEAKVPGVESKSLDEGHVIADSLGGVSNAYNITPQNSTLNRHGDQAYMEDTIRKAGGCKDFVAIITYPNTTTQIPNHYSYKYTLNGQVIKDEFDNVNPEKPTTKQNSNNKSTNKNTPPVTSNNASTGDVVYWTPKGYSYHTTRNCPTLSKSKTILEGSLQQSGKNDPCNKCH